MDYTNLAIYAFTLLVFVLTGVFNRPNKLLTAVFYLYICGVLTLTILPIPLQYGIQLSSSFSFNLEPFIDILNNTAGARYGVLLNVLLFVPMGFFLATLSKKPRFFKALLAFVTLSILIELTQLSYWVIFSNSSRICDVTDLITNTAGGIIGYPVGLIVRYFIKKR